MIVLHFFFSCSFFNYMCVFCNFFLLNRVNESLIAERSLARYHYETLAPLSFAIPRVVIDGLMLGACVVIGVLAVVWKSWWDVPLHFCLLVMLAIHCVFLLLQDIMLLFGYGSLLSVFTYIQYQVIKLMSVLYVAVSGNTLRLSISE